MGFIVKTFPMLIRASKFLLVGTVVTLIHLAISYSLVHLGYSLLLANCIAFGIAFLISYFLQSSFTFRHGYSVSKLMQFGGAALTALLASQCVAYACIVLSVPDKWGVLFSGLTPPVISFLLNNFLVFKTAREP